MKAAHDLGAPREIANDPRSRGARELRMQVPEELRRDHESPLPIKRSAALNIFLSLTVSGLALVATLVAIEIGYRLLPSSAGRNWQDRPQLYFSAEKAATTQDYFYSSQKPAGAFRIAVIGDSFTFAPYMQFDDTFSKRLERWLNLNEHQPKVEVLNLGVPAYSTNHEVPVVKESLEGGANLIIVQITLNDPELKPYTPQQLLLDRNQFGDYEPAEWLRHWKSAVFVLSRLHNNSTRKNYIKKFFDLFDKRRTWENFSKSWAKIAELAESKKVPVIAVIFPLFGLPVDDSYPFWPIHQKIAQLMNELKVPALDITEAYRNIPVDRLQVLPGKDFHPNEIAHRIAAEQMYGWLAEKRLVPEAALAKDTAAQRIGIRKGAL